MCVCSCAYSHFQFMNLLLYTCDSVPPVPVCQITGNIPSQLNAYLLLATCSALFRELVVILMLHVKLTSNSL